MTALDILRNANDGIDRIIAERDDARAEAQDWQVSATMRRAEADELRNALVQLRERVAEYENFIDTEGARTLKIEKERDALRKRIAELTICDCGLPLSTGLCGICDNDE